MKQITYSIWIPHDIFRERRINYEICIISDNGACFHLGHAKNGVGRSQNFVKVL